MPPVRMRVFVVWLPSAKLCMSEWSWTRSEYVPAVRTSTCFPLASARSIVNPGPTVPISSGGAGAAGGGGPHAGGGGGDRGGGVLAAEGWGGGRGRGDGFSRSGTAL